MLVGLLATGIVSKVPYIFLKVDDLRDDTQSLVQARIQVEEIASESDTGYGYANDGRVTLSFNVTSIDGSMPADQGVTFTIGSSYSQINTITTRGTNVTFTGFNAGIYELSARDESLDATFKMSLAIGYGAESSYIHYKNADYVGTGSVYFVPVLCKTINNSGADFSITNLRNGFATINCNGIAHEPYNKPLSGNHLSKQQFNIVGLDSRRTSPYATAVVDPITRVTHNLSLSAGYKDYAYPSLKINYLNSETANTNDGSLSLTFNSTETLSANGVTISLDNGTNTVVQSTTRGTPVVFSNLDSSLVVNNNLIITDHAKNRTWNLKLRIGYESGLSYIQHDDNILYQTGDTIIFKADQSSNPIRTKLVYQNKIYNKGDTLILS